MEKSKQWHPDEPPTYTQDEVEAMLAAVGKAVLDFLIGEVEDNIAIKRHPVLKRGLEALAKTTVPQHGLVQHQSPNGKTYIYVKECPRCGDDHNWVEFEALCKPAPASPTTYIAICPQTKEPIFAAKDPLAEHRRLI